MKWVAIFVVIMLFVTYTFIHNPASAQPAQACEPNEIRVCGTNIGECVSGFQVCENGAWGICDGQVGPSQEICDNLDNNCNGQTDEIGCDCSDGETKSCGSNIGTCTSGFMACVEGTWGMCVGDIEPQDEVCDNLDNNCNGEIDEGLDCLALPACTEGETRLCGSNIGECSSGVRTCSDGVWGECVGDAEPQEEICDGLDNNCNGEVDDSCISGPSGPEPPLASGGDPVIQAPLPRDLTPPLMMSQSPGYHPPEVMLINPKDNSLVGVTQQFGCVIINDSSTTSIDLYGEWDGGWHLNQTHTDMEYELPNRTVYSTTCFSGDCALSNPPKYAVDDVLSTYFSDTNAGGQDPPGEYWLAEFQGNYSINKVHIYWFGVIGDYYALAGGKNNTIYIQYRHANGSSVWFNVSEINPSGGLGNMNKNYTFAPVYASAMRIYRPNASETTYGFYEVDFYGVGSGFTVAGIEDGAHYWNCKAHYSTQEIFAAANSTVYRGAQMVELKYPYDHHIKNTAVNTTFKCDAGMKNLVNVSLWGNWSGSWHLNQTIYMLPVNSSGYTNNTNQFSTTQNPDGSFTTYFRPDATYGTDTYIESGAGAHDPSGYLEIISDYNKHGILRFNLDKLTAIGAEVVEAKFNLTPKQSGIACISFSGTVPIHIQRITSNWSESEANWTHRNSTTQWNTAGGDRDGAYQEGLSESNVYESCSSKKTATFTITSLVQDWVTAKYQNHGLILTLTGADNTQWHSSDSVSYRPLLTVTYFVPDGANAVFNVTNMSQGSYAWNCEAYNNTKSVSAPANFTLNINPCLPPTDEDWNISYLCNMFDEELYLGANKDLNVLDGGELNLFGTKLWITTSKNDNSNLHVWPGGEFQVMNDGPIGSMINASNLHTNYSIIVYSNSNFTMVYSHLEGAGWANVEGQRGLEIKTGNMTFENNIVKNNYNGIYLLTSNVTIKNNQFMNNDRSVSVNLQGSIIPENVTIKNNTFLGDYKSISIDGDAATHSTIHNITIINNTIKNCLSDGISIIAVPNSTITNNTIVGCVGQAITVWGGHGFMGMYETNFYNNNISYNIIANTTGYAIKQILDIGYGIENSTFLYNVFENNTYGIYLNPDNPGVNTNFTSCFINNSIYDYETVGNHDNFINMTFNKSSVIISGLGNLTFIWYLDVHVKDHLGDDISGANVSVFNTSKDLAFYDLTEVSGSIEPTQQLVEYIQGPDGQHYWTNYTINVTKSGFINYSGEINLTGSIMLDVQLLKLGEVEPYLELPVNMYNVPRQGLMVINASFLCVDGYCGNVSATPRSMSGMQSFKVISDVFDASPFFIAEGSKMQYKELNEGDSLNASWIVNASGSPGQYQIDANFSSNMSLSGSTAQRTVTIKTPPAVHLNSPANMTLVNQSYVEFVCNASHADKIKNISLYSDMQSEYAYDKSMILWYHLNNDTLYGESSNFIYDHSGYGTSTNDIYDDAQPTEAGRFYGGFLFDGDGDEVHISQSGVVNVSRYAELTVSLWANRTTQSKNEPFIGNSGGSFLLAAGDDGTVNVYLLTNYDGGPYWWQAAKTDDLGITWKNEWHHVAFTYNSSNNYTKIYVDGKLKKFNEYAAGGPLIDIPGDIWIGYENNRYFNGTLDEIAIFNRTLSDEEVSQLYSSWKRIETKIYGGRNVEEYAKFNYTPQDGEYIWTCDACSYTDSVCAFNDTNRTLRIDRFPGIEFIPPTPDEGTFTSNSRTQVNTSVADVYSPKNLTAFIDWNRSLVGWWTFNENAGQTAYDKSSWGNNGRLGSSTGADSQDPDWTFYGKFGPALDFNGVSTNGDYINVGTDSSLDIKWNITVEAWIKPRDSSPPSYQFILAKGDIMDDEQQYWLFVNATGNILFGYADRLHIGSDVVGSSKTLDENKMYHVVGVFNSTNLMMYVNGNLECIEDKTTTPTAGSTQTLTIGAMYIFGYGVVSSFNGTIDEVRIWNRSLSNEEINASYNAGLQRLYANFTGLIDGDYKYISYVQDISGNINQTERRNFSSDQKDPSIWFVDPTNHDGKHIPNNWSYVNVSVFDTVSDKNMTAFINWNRSLLGWWSFNENTGTVAADISGWGNDGGLGPNDFDFWPVWTEAGKFGPGLNFNVKNQSVQIPSSNSLTDVFNFSIEAWINPSSIGSSGYILTNYNPASTAENSVLLYRSGSRINFKADGTQTVITDSGSVSTHKWYHVVVNVDAGDEISIYINGMERGSTTVVPAGPFLVSENPFVIGLLPQMPYTGQFTGTIDEVRIWNRTLSGDEINASYKAGLYRLENNFTGLPDGYYEYKAHVQDLAGNLNETEMRNVTIDVTSPNIWFVDPTNPDGKKTARNWNYVNVSVSDATHPDNVTAFIDWNRSLVGWWAFNENTGQIVHDKSSWGNDGVLGNDSSDPESRQMSYPNWTDGRFGSSLTFDGVDDEVIILDSPNFHEAHEGLMVNVWIKEYHEDYYSTPGSPISRWYSGNFEGWGMRENNWYSMDTGDTLRALDAGRIVTDNHWHMYTFVYNLTYVASYVDAMPNDLSVTEALDVDFDGNMSIGRSGMPDGTYFFPGIIEDVMIFNRPLSLEELQALYDAGSYRLEQNFTELDEGVYNYTAYAQDVMGNINQTETRGVTVVPTILNLDKLINPQTVVARTEEPVEVSVILELEALANEVFSINVSDDVPDEAPDRIFTPPEVEDVHVYFHESGGLQTEITGDTGVTVTVQNQIINVTILNLTETTLGKNAVEGDYINITYNMTSSEMEPDTEVNATTNVSIADIDMITTDANITKTIYSAVVVLRGYKSVWIPDPSNPQNISVRIAIYAIGGPIGEIELSDYLPQGAAIYEHEVKYFNYTNDVIMPLTDPNGYEMTGPFQDTLPDGTYVDIYFYNFSKNCNNWGCYLYDKDNITIDYNTTVLGGGTWELPAILGGFDPSYNKHIKTEMYTSASVPSFDVMVETLTRTIVPGDVVKAKLTMLNVGGPLAKVDVHAISSIKTMDGDLIIEKSETFAVVETKEKELVLMAPSTLEPGIYIFEVFVTYTGREAVSTDTFEVKGSGSSGTGGGLDILADMFTYIFVLLGVILAAIFLIVVVLLKRTGHHELEPPPPRPPSLA